MTVRDFSRKITYFSRIFLERWNLILETNLTTIFRSQFVRYIIFFSEKYARHTDKDYINGEVKV